MRYISSDLTVAHCENNRVIAVGDGICTVIAISDSGASAATIVKVGEVERGTTPEQFLKLDVTNVPSIVKTVDKASGRITSMTAITSYDVFCEFINGSTVTTVTLNCVKIYDIEGVENKGLVLVSTGLYMEDGKFCESREYRMSGYKVGDSFSVTCKRFGATIKDVPREFELVVRDVAEY